MKNLFKIALLFAIVLFTGCSTDDTSTTNTTGNAISFTMNGVNKTVPLKSARLVKLQVSNEKVFEIIAEDNENVFQIVLYSNYSADDGIPTGSYVFEEDITEGYVSVGYKNSGNTYSVHFPNSGSINITTIDSSSKMISGTFNQILDKGGDFNDFTQPLPMQLVITNGEFNNIPYTVESY